MSLKYKILFAGAILVVAFSAGRWSVNAPTVKTVETQHETDQQTEDKNTHKKEVIVEVKKPDGTDTTTTTVEQVTNDSKTNNDNIDTHVEQTVTPPKKNMLNISILGANDFGKGLLAPTYGLSVHKEVLGPITVGAFGLVNGTVGISVGLDF